MKTPAEWKTLFESSAFARQTNYSGPLGPEYNPSGTRLRLWAPTAQSVSVNLYRRGAQSRSRVPEGLYSGPSGPL